MGRKKPSSVVVGGFTYSIGWDPEEIARISKEDDHDGLTGHFNGTTQVINIHGGAHVEQQRVALVHEILHACFWVVGLEEVKDEEFAVSVVSAAFTQTLRENPKVTAWLLEP